MATGTRGAAWFVIGIVAMAFVIGLLGGASASPVVAVLLPLLFGLFSLGGTVVILRKAVASEDSVGYGANEIGLLGKQLIGFAAGFLFGMWLGVAVKTNAIRAWPEPPNARAAFAVMESEDMLLLSAAIHLDGRMQAAGLPFEKRREVFELLRAGILIRSKSQNRQYAMLREHEIASAVLQGLKDARPSMPPVSSPGPSPSQP